MTVRASRGQVAALMVAHCAGMIDLVALPVWVGALVQHQQLDPQQAGMLVSLFLIGAVLASVGLAPRLQRLRPRTVAAPAYTLAAAAFGLMATVLTMPAMVMGHAIAGLGVGAGLSLTHGTIARSERPHRLFAVVGIALGVFAVVFLGGSAQLVARLGTASLFTAFAVVMALAALACGLGFPSAAGETPERRAAPAGRLPSAVWLGIAGICAMSLAQAMTFSFAERVGQHRGFGLDAITGVLIALGLINLTPAALAALLERRLPARQVVRVGPVVQALVGFTVMTASGFAPWAVAMCLFSAVMIFTHTFAFGMLAGLDPSGRALAATPAMLMTGSALGPVIGGTLVKFHGYEAVGLAMLVVGGVAAICLHLAGRTPAAIRSLA